MRRHLIPFLLCSGLFLACEPPPVGVEEGPPAGGEGWSDGNADTGESTEAVEDPIGCDKETLAILCCCEQGASTQPLCHGDQWICPVAYELHLEATCLDPLGPCSTTGEETGVSPPEEEPDVSPGWAHPCATPTVVEAYETKAAVHVSACSSCHSAVVVPEVLKTPGGLWYNPSDAVDTVSRMLQLEIFDALHPETSAFLLKPLPGEQGGVPHVGGDFFNKNVKSWLGLHDFAMTAVHCLQQLP
jgi:hypothetical protein